ncbi:MAG TPA: 5-oxoprolinase subunit PxpA [Candidatus Eremiobacteraceae bacterium]
MKPASHIDLNCDMGELPGPRGRASDEELLALVTSANVACGGHAGDAASMEATVLAAAARGVSVGAHPSYADRANFGRRSRAQSPGDAAAALIGQLTAFREIANTCDVSLRHVKPHGALYNDAAVDWSIATAVAGAVATFNASLVLVGLAGSLLLDAGRAAGLQVAAEGFCDRAYETDGTLRARALPGAVFDDPELAARQAVRLAQRGDIDTLCIHGDTEAAVPIARAVRAALGDAVIRIAKL